jgi:hypothetical protein
MQEVIREYGLALFYGVIGAVLIGCFITVIGQLSF